MTPLPSNYFLTLFIPIYVAMNQIPMVDQLSHVNQLSETVWQQPGNRTNITAVTTQLLYIGGGLPPIPKKLVHRIQAGRFINMSKIFLNTLEASNSTDNDQNTISKRIQQDIT